MKHSYLTVVAAASLFAIGACGQADTVDYIEPVEEVVPVPVPAPPAQPMPMDTTQADTTAQPDTTPGA